jgi:hypothetical protein
MSENNPCTQYLPGSGAYEFVDKEYTAYTDRIRNLSTDAAVDIDALTQFTPDFSSLPFEVDVSPIEDVDAPVIDLPAGDAPDYLAPDSVYNTEPPGDLVTREFDDGSGITAVGSAPLPDYGQLIVRDIAPPNVTLPASVGPAPLLPDRVEPDDPTVVLPDIPVLQPIGDAGPAPVPDIQNFDKTIPVFQPPSDALQDVYFADHSLKQAEVAAFVSSQAEIPEVRAALTSALNGEGIIVPAWVQEQVFNGTRSRAVEGSRQAQWDAVNMWAAKGFELPGAGILASNIETGRSLTAEQARINAEILNVTYVQAVETYRDMIGRGLAHEAALYNVYVQIDANARELANGHFAVLQGIYNISIALFDLQIKVYLAEIAVYEANIQIELAKIEAYKASIDALRLLSDLNTQQIELYNAQIRGSLAIVQIYQAQVSAFNGLIQSDLAKVSAFNAKVNAYSAEVDAVSKEIDIYEAEVSAEGTKAQVYGTTVDAYRARIEGYSAQLGAEATKTTSINSVVLSESEVYKTQVDAWSAGVTTDVRRIEASVAQFRAEIEAYTAELSRDETSGRLQALGFDKELQRATLIVENEIKNIDRALAQLTTSSELELSRLSDAAKINAQLAAASMASLSISASLQGSDSWSAGSSSTCSTNYSGALTG